MAVAKFNNGCHPARAMKRNVLGIERAKRAGLPVEIVERKPFASLEAFSNATFSRSSRGPAADGRCCGGPTIEA